MQSHNQENAIVWKWSEVCLCVVLSLPKCNGEGMVGSLVLYVCVGISEW